MVGYGGFVFDVCRCVYTRVLAHNESPRERVRKFKIATGKQTEKTDSEDGALR